MAELTDQQRFEQGQQDYTFLRPATRVAEAVGIPTTTDDALRLAAGPRASIAAWMLGAGNKLAPAVDPVPTPPVEPEPSTITRETPTVPNALADAPNSPRFPIPGPTDEYISPQLGAILRSKVPGNYAPLIADNPPPAEGRARDEWKKANGWPTDAELQQKIDAFAAMEGSPGRIADNGQPAYQFAPPVEAVPPVRYQPAVEPVQIQPVGAEPPVRGQAPFHHPTDYVESPLAQQVLARPDYDTNAIFDPRTGQTMGQAVDELEADYRAGRAGVGQPGRGNFPPEPPRPPSPEPNVGKPGVMVTPEQADKMLAAEDARIAAREAAALPRATRVKTLLRGAAADFLDMVPAADGLVTSALVGGTLANMSAEANTPEGRIRENSFSRLQRPLNLGQVGSDAEFLRMNPDVAEKLYREGAIEGDAYYQIMSQPPSEGNLEPMRQAMRRIGG